MLLVSRQRKMKLVVRTEQKPSESRSEERIYGRFSEQPFGHHGLDHERQRASHRSSKLHLETAGQFCASRPQTTQLRDAQFEIVAKSRVPGIDGEYLNFVSGEIRTVRRAGREAERIAGFQI